MNNHPSKLKVEILRLTREYSDLIHQAQRPAEANHVSFVPGQTIIPYAGRVFTADEVEAAVSVTLDFWLTLGVEGEAFEKELAAFLGVKHTLLVNSGSSANLVAIAALASGETISVRNKTATRPWQHVLEPLSGYLWLAAALSGLLPARFPLPAAAYAGAFNFGPTLASNRTVADIVQDTGRDGGLTKATPPRRTKQAGSISRQTKPITFCNGRPRGILRRSLPAPSPGIAPLLPPAFSQPKSQPTPPPQKPPASLGRRMP
jgi:hypothetical protein